MALPLHTFDQSSSRSRATPETHPVQSRFKYRPLKSGQFRLLRPRPSKTGELSYELVHEKVSSDKNYVALSYTWGSPQLTHHIYLDGQLFPVRQNLYDALVQLQKDASSSAAQYRWIDALCIDQSPDPQAVIERSSQILLMGKIYQLASTVYV